MDQHKALEEHLVRQNKRKLEVADDVLVGRRTPKAAKRRQSRRGRSDEEDVEELLDAALDADQENTDPLLADSYEHFFDELVADCDRWPMLRLSPPATDRDYHFSLGENEGVGELFEVRL